MGLFDKIKKAFSFGNDKDKDNLNKENLEVKNEVKN